MGIPDLNDISKAASWYDEDYWQRGPETGKSNYANWGICEPWDTEFIEHFERAVPLQGKTFLDVGCAFGGIVWACLKKGIEAYGQDIGCYAIEAGHRLFPSLSKFTAVSSAHELPYGNEFFDVIHCNQVCEHIPEMLVPQMFREIHRVMKPGAVAWFGTVFNEEKSNPDHITVRPFEFWRDQVADAGLVMDMSIDDKFRATKLQFFDQCKWHSFSFRKP
jgi:2-polyprenyl-3-methyl-5-hydroxy-6-metoxy-1,4-benzoquinol methylase